MTTEYKLNTLIEWTEEDRAKGGCPVPAGSDVTVWFADGTCQKINAPTTWNWSDTTTHEDEDEEITAYLIHSVPREPIVVWRLMDGRLLIEHFDNKDEAEKCRRKYGGRVVKMVEVIE